MKKEVGTKTVIVVLVLVVLAILMAGWKVIFAPKPGEGPPPPASTAPKPPAPPGTYFPPNGGPPIYPPGKGPSASGNINMAAPNPADLTNGTRQPGR